MRNRMDREIPSDGHACALVVFLIFAMCVLAYAS